MKQFFQFWGVFFVLCLSSLSEAGEVVFFVDPSGVDTNPGTQAKPFRSILKGLEATRKLVGTTKVLSLAGGRYELGDTLVLGEDDRGLTIRATDPKDRPRLIGGRVLDAFTVLKDREILEKLPPAVRGKVVEVNLKSQQIRDMGKLMPLGFGHSGTSAMEVFVNGQRGTLARYPNHGWLTIKSIPKGRSGREITLDVGEERLKKWSREPEPWVYGYWYHGWADRFLGVEKVDVGKRCLTLQDVKHYGLRKGQRFFAMNLLCELDAPGEYWIDRQGGKLYLYLEETGKEREVIVSMLESPLILINGVNGVQLRGLVVEAGRGNGIEVKNSESVTIVQCLVRNLGAEGILISGGESCKVTACEVRDTGATGISVTGGDRKTLTPAGHLVFRNHVHHVSRLRRTYTPAISLNGVGNRAIRNLLHDAPHQAIAFNGNDHLISGNEIHHVVLETDDAGAIYTCPRDYTSRGTLIRWNYLHHCGPQFAPKVPKALRTEKNVSYEPMHLHGTSLIYLDDLTGGMRIEGNVLDGGYRAMLIGGGRDNQITKNLILGGNIGIWIDGRGLGWAAKNVAKGGPHGLFRKFAEMRGDQSPYVVRYPGLKTALSDHPAAPVNTVARGNLVLGAKTWKKTDGKSDPYIRWEHNIHVPKPNGLPVDASPEQWLEKAEASGVLGRKELQATGVDAIPFSEIGM
jgi:hypothetical protein